MKYFILLSFLSISLTVSVFAQQAVLVQKGQPFPSTPATVSTFLIPDSMMRQIMSDAGSAEIRKKQIDSLTVLVANRDSVIAKSHAQTVIAQECCTVQTDSLKAVLNELRTVKKELSDASTWHWVYGGIGAVIGVVVGTQIK